jgi:16S rRNA (guanine(1405)-N(7))-methyltransferase
MTSVAEVVSAVQTSKRYQWVLPAVVERLAGEEIPKSRNAADAQKRTKRRLHQIFGAYASPLPYATMATRIDALPHDPDELESLCCWVLGLHSSTRERLPLLPEFYADIFRLTGRPTSIFDLACGLNPFAWPWMGLDASCAYFAYDIDLQLHGLLDRFLTRLGVEHHVGLIDVLMPFEVPRADVALLLKAIPCLEQQRAGAGLEVLDRLRARWRVVSYPTQSLGGRGKGMAHTYRMQFEAMLEQRPWTFRELNFPGELVFVIDTSA